MQNNKVLKDVRYALKLRNKKMEKIFKLGSIEITEDEVEKLLSREKTREFMNCNNKYLHGFLNGLIIYYRGGSEENAKKISKFVKISKTNANNLVLKKLKVALSLKAEDISTIFKMGDIEVTNSEISGMLRGESSKIYRTCGDKYLRKFLRGLIAYKRGNVQTEKQVQV
ncbi:MAG: DUF1456 family protein [Fusobacteriaceae bacterium]|jgi:uncharacterized protein YehS (DUF1456 family)|nr:DUF1456 family protein [Fusobacteriaceae bacterium]